MCYAVPVDHSKTLLADEKKKKKKKKKWQEREQEVFRISERSVTDV